jgi:hypothetical protein
MMVTIIVWVAAKSVTIRPLWMNELLAAKQKVSQARCAVATSVGAPTNSLVDACGAE